MNFLYSFFAFVFSLIASWLLVAALIPYLKRDLLDLPNHRSSHIQPTPSGGGISFVLVSSFSSILSLVLNFFFPSFLSPLLFASLLLLPLSLVGFIDDRVNLPSSLRYLFQLGTAFFVVKLSSLAVFSSGFILILFLIITVTAVINFVNFMDGLDGLVAGCMSLTIAVSAIHLSAPWAIWSLVGALIGFLIFNWSPASIFMVTLEAPFSGLCFQSLFSSLLPGLTRSHCYWLQARFFRRLLLRYQATRRWPARPSASSSAFVSAVTSVRHVSWTSIHFIYIGYQSYRIMPSIRWILLGTHLCSLCSSCRHLA